jgi:hypothetical protein
MLAHLVSPNINFPPFRRHFRDATYHQVTNLSLVSLLGRQNGDKLVHPAHRRITASDMAHIYHVIAKDGWVIRFFLLVSNIFTFVPLYDTGYRRKQPHCGRGVFDLHSIDTFAPRPTGGDPTRFIRLQHYNKVALRLYLRHALPGGSKTYLIGPMP